MLNIEGFFTHLQHRVTILVPLTVLVAVLAVACGGSAATDTPVPTVESLPTVPSDLILGNPLQGADPEFDSVAMSWQAYWLSRNHFGPFVMASGMGIPFQPPMETMQMGMEMVAQNPNDPVAIPQNMVPLQAVYASGSPNLINDPRDYDPMDFEGLRLDTDSFDQVIAVRGQAETMLKEAQWAHIFSSSHVGEPTGDFGAQQRFMGVMVAMMAQMQGQYAMQNLLGENGLYHDSNGSVDYTGNWVMLHALSDLALLTGESGGSSMNPEVHSIFDGAATQLFRALENREPESAREGAAAIRALIYRAYTATDNDVRSATLNKAQSIADSVLINLRSDDVVENFAAVAGLVAIGSAIDHSEYRDAADALFNDVSSDFDPVHGVFRSKGVYNVDDVAWIIGGLNFLSKRGNEGSREASKDMLLAFYESTISLAGMQQSAPPGKDGAMAGEWEKNLPNVLYYHPRNTPSPAMVGKLPVPAEEITWDGTAWQITSDRFVPAGAMHLANELNWLGPPLGSIPFPPINDQPS